jgi:fructuronate reductase
VSHILHFGLGNFHRAHQAWYTDLANRKSGAQWQITGMSLRSATVRDILQPQHCDYTLVISGQAGEGACGIYLCERSDLRSAA